MGPIILVFIVAMLIILLVSPAIRERLGRQPPQPPSPGEPQDEPYEVVVRRLDDHRKNKPGDEPPTA